MKILIQDQNGVRALEEGFASEEELQTFLREHPDLMPLEEIDLNAPPLLCIGWEVGLASGAEDILYIDENGLLTIVETKLRKNPEARREVVGQILEYAAQMSTWTSTDVERQAQKFFASPQSPDQYRGRTLEEALQLFLESAGGPPDFSYDDFLEHVQTNIERGHFRLVIAIDEPPEPLLKTVEFVNRFSERFEMYLIQLKRFRDPARKQNIFIPALFGRVATTRTTRQPEKWDEERFRQELQAKNDPQTVEYTLTIYQRLKEWADVPLWGSGATYGSFNLVVIKDGDRINVASVTTEGKLWINFGWITSKVGEDVPSSLLDDLRHVQGLILPPDAIKKYPLIPHSVLRDPTRRQLVLDAISRAVQRIRSSA